MGTYTTNYNLFMPTVGEQGWGELVNGNFTTIDTTMKGLNTRIGTLEAETDAVEERVTTLEKTIPEEGVVNADSIVVNSLTCTTIDIEHIKLLVECNPSGSGNIAFTQHAVGNLGVPKYSTTTFNNVNVNSVDFIFEGTSGITYKPNINSYTTVGWKSGADIASLSSLNLVATYADGSTKSITSTADKIYFNGLVNITGSFSGKNNTLNGGNVEVYLNAARLIN